MVLPDRPERETTRARPTALWAGVGVAALLAGFGVLAALTSPELVAEPTTTTSPEPDTTFDAESFSVADIVTGPDLEWRRTLSVENQFVNGLLSHGGAVLLYASETPWWLSSDGPMNAWSSGSGFEWSPHDRVLDAVGGGTITSNGANVVTVSAGLGRASMLHTSDDGITWQSEVVPTDGPESHSVNLRAAAVSGRSRVVAGFTFFDTEARLRRYLEEQHQIDLGLFQYEWAEAADTLIYTILGPLGLPVFEVTSEELGFGEEELASATGGTDGPPEGIAWVNFNDEGWVSTEVPELRGLNTILVAPDDTFLAHGWSIRGSTIWHSPHGIEWVMEDPDGLPPESIVRWRDGFASARLQGLPSLLTSHDGLTWERHSLEGLLPSGMSWGYEHLDGGQAGLGMVASSWDGFSFEDQSEREPLVVEQGDIFFVFDFSEGNVRILTPDGEQSFPIYSSSIPEWIQVDVVNETFSFLDEGSGELLAELGFEELRQAEVDYWSSSDWANSHSALLFTPDGATWWIDDFRADVGPDAHVIDMTITHDSIVLAVTGLQPFQINQPPGFEIWTAPLP